MGRVSMSVEICPGGGADSRWSIFNLPLLMLSAGGAVCKLFFVFVNVAFVTR